MSRKISLSAVASNFIVANIKPNITSVQNVDGSQTITLSYNIPAHLIKEFDDWKIKMEHLIDKNTKEHILED